MFDKTKVNYSRFSIIQASNLKKILEQLWINRDEVTIASVDAINMYTTIKLLTGKKSVMFLKRKLTAATKKTIKLYLELIILGMISTLIHFDGEYYEYHRREK